MPIKTLLQHRPMSHCTLWVEHIPMMHQSLNSCPPLKTWSCDQSSGFDFCYLWAKWHMLNNVESTWVILRQDYATTVWNNTKSRNSMYSWQKTMSTRIIKRITWMTLYLKQLVHSILWFLIGVCFSWGSNQWHLQLHKSIA